MSVFCFARRRIKYGLDHWTIGLFFGLLLILDSLRVTAPSLAKMKWRRLSFTFWGEGAATRRLIFGPFFRTIFGPILDLFWDQFLDLFWDHFIGGGRPLVLRERWDAVYQYSGRGGRQTVVTEGGVEDELLLRK